jgi:hypothetical protein
MAKEMAKEWAKVRLLAKDWAKATATKRSLPARDSYRASQMHLCLPHHRTVSRPSTDYNSGNRCRCGSLLLCIKCSCGIG